ncbi:MAG: azurin [Porticoccaceae bacterium]|jgi:azurin|nr:azurin [Porticoccaceae bacterium]|tara:strand:+ start:189 stop:641 length:453 start_codon:yes stop_codon:yes gene_type:complete
MKQITKFLILVGVVSFTSLSQAACSFDVEVGDYLKFSTPDMAVEKSCESITVNLKHTGKLPANIMGHNWVLSADADVQALATEGMSAGLVSNYVPPGDARVLAVTSVIGGGESTSVTFSTAGLASGDAYTFFCSFPGHSYSMRGALTVSP